MSGWGKIPDEMKEIIGFKKVGSGASPDNLGVLLAANAAVSGVDLGCKDCHTHAPNNTKGGGRGI